MKKIIIESFMARYSKSHTVEGDMPKHIWHRWYGIDGRFYNILWSRLDGDNDEYLFDDFCDISFDVQNGNREWMKKLSKERLNKLFKFSFGMLTHFLVVNSFWKIVEFFIKIAYKLTKRPEAL